ncbi:MAG: hypothetical protein HS111_08050 [Kofleriaceae bacterium]|nr:hypothetical protein [Kofleriaceae bacterium]MCL4223704.1 hypothetical protein [Myxococcales bacterium]
MRIPSIADLTRAVTALALVVAPAGCVVGAEDPGDDLPPPDGIAGSITRDQTWAGAQTLVADATIEAGATVTVTAGAAIEARDGVTLRVKGTLRIEGTAADKVTLLPTADALSWAGIVADPGATVSLAHVEGTDVATLVYCHAGATCDLSHVVFDDLGKALVVAGTATLARSRISKVVNGGVTVMGGALTITDSHLLTSSGDVVVQSGGALIIEHSEIGEAMGSYEHCNLHVGAAETLRITRSNIRAGVYGLMLGGTSGAVMQYNNWIENDPGLDIAEVGVNTAVDLRFSYWDQGAPDLGPAYDTSSPSPTRIADAGPRPE